MKLNNKNQQRIRRHKRVRKVVKGSAKKPRLCVFRSLSHIYVQAIDDDSGKTIFSVNDLELSKKKDSNCTVDLAGKVGEELAKKAIKNNIKEVRFDRGGHRYHGQVKAIADGARKGGLKF